MRYSVLDLFRSPAQSVEVARRADYLGFHRYWVGEHHSATQCTNPLLLGAILLGVTDQIRIGTGPLGILARSPITIAEDVQMMRTLFGDRFDLGLSKGFVGTAPDGSGDEIRRLLLDSRDERAIRADFIGRIERTRSHLGDESSPPFWLIGSSAESARIAGGLSMGFCTSFYHASSIDALERAIAEYRDAFVPGKGLTASQCILVQSGLCAPSTEAAVASLRFFLRDAESPGDELTTRPMGPWLYAGDGAGCREAIDAAVARFRPDELMIHNLLLPDAVDLEIQSLEVLAPALGLDRVALDAATEISTGDIP
jgi:alkanesulfonate monooxygenase SsuD/methylene tetrahydromethanopterin reductase-like flavin-dependent oxidoreductase (luciferase family)